jgi:hypothetical protein
MADSPDPEVERAVLERYVGSYRMKDGREVRVELRGPELTCSLDGIEWIPMFAETPERFFVEGEDQRLVFVSDEAGQVTGIEVLIFDQVILFDRVAE